MVLAGRPAATRSARPPRLRSRDVAGGRSSTDQVSVAHWPAWIVVVG